MNFDEKLKILRSKAGISQQALADAIGLSQRTIASSELGGSYPNFEQLPKIARFFGVTIDSLMTDDECFVAEAQEQNGRKGVRQATLLVNEVAALFSGGTLTDEDRDAAMREIQNAYWVAKEESKRKYTPKKYRAKPQQGG